MRKRLPCGMDEAGLSLIEVVLALGILAIGLLAVFTLHFAAVRNATTGNLSTQAQILATLTIENLKSQDMLDPSSRLNGPYSTDADNNTGPDLSGVDFNDTTNFNGQGEPGGPFELIVRVFQRGTLTRKVDVTVAWREKGNVRSVRYSALTRGGGE